MYVFLSRINQWNKIKPVYKTSGCISLSRINQWTATRIAKRMPKLYSQIYLFDIKIIRHVAKKAEMLRPALHNMATTRMLCTALRQGCRKKSRKVAIKRRNQIKPVYKTSGKSRPCHLARCYANLFRDIFYPDFRSGFFTIQNKLIEPK